MLSSVEQAFVGRDERRASLKTLAMPNSENVINYMRHFSHRQK